MHSVTYDESSRTHARTARDLLVLWQDPASRRILIVGRLGYDGASYSFVYTRGAARAFDAGFRGLPGLRRAGRRYESVDLFPVFAQRTLDPTREDYQGYLEQVGLEGSATPLEQIVHSGGRRVADTIQLLEAPQLAGTEISSVFLAHGVRHIPKRPLQFAEGPQNVPGDKLEEALRRLAPGVELSLRDEPGNAANPRAIVLTSPEGTPVGYVPDELVEGIRVLIEEGTELSVTACHVNEPDAPVHLRLLVALRATGVRHNPFEVETWQPDVTYAK